MNGLEVLDLFCGAGGFSEGFKQAGFNIIFGIDNDKWSCKTFKWNFPKAEVICEDIRNFNNYPKCDVIIGSPPCKEFSKGNIDRTWDTKLVDRFLEIIKQAEPKFWVMENVPEVIDVINNLTGKYKRIFNVSLILNAYDFGCATTRTRLFAGNFPKEIKKSKEKKAVKDVININRAGYRQPYKDNVYRHINPNKPFVTLVSQRICNERYLLPNGTSLEVSEMATIQGFPSNFVFPVSRSEAQKQVGNSVCPPVAKAIAEQISLPLKPKGMSIREAT